MLVLNEKHSSATFRKAIANVPSSCLDDSLRVDAEATRKDHDHTCAIRPVDDERRPGKKGRGRRRKGTGGEGRRRERLSICVQQLKG